jgi:hypothetical protein
MKKSESGQRFFKRFCGFSKSRLFPVQSRGSSSVSTILVCSRTLVEMLYVRRWCCWSCRPKAPLQEQQYGNDHSMPANLKDLVDKPETIDPKLNDMLVEWENAVNDLHEAEADIMDNYDDETACGMIKSVKENPTIYLSHSELFRLAQLVNKVNEIERKLPTQSDQESTKTTRSTRSVTDASWIADKLPSDLRLNAVMGKLSSIWTQRLNSINPTQGALTVMSKDDSNLRKDDLKLKPKWPDYLTDMAYDVIKVNKYGHRMRRTLKLTRHHVISIKAGEAITKYYPYSHIAKAWLENETTIKVILKSDKRNMYISPIAPHILQQFITRVQVRKALDEKFLGSSLTDTPNSSMKGLPGYSADFTAEIIKSISEENTYATEEMLFNFANELKLRTIQSTTGEEMKVRTASMDISPKTSSKIRKNTTISTKSSRLSSSIRDMPESNKEAPAAAAVDEDEMVKNPLAPSEEKKENFTETEESNNKDTVNGSVEIEEMKKDESDDGEEEEEEKIEYEDNGKIELAYHYQSTSSILTDATNTSTVSAPSSVSRLSSFKENTPEYLLQTTIRKIVFDPETSEGNTRKIFISNFTKPLTEGGISVDELILKIRHYIDGMHEYILNERAFSLSMIYQQEKQRLLALEEVKKNRSFSSVGETTDSTNIHQKLFEDQQQQQLQPQSSQLQQQQQQQQQQTPTTLQQLKKQQKHNPFLRRNSLNFLKNNNIGIMQVDDSLLTIISYIVFIIVEESIFLSIQEKIISLIRSKNDVVSVLPVMFVFLV